LRCDPPGGCTRDPVTEQANPQSRNAVKDGARLIGVQLALPKLAVHKRRGVGAEDVCGDELMLVGVKPST